MPSALPSTDNSCPLTLVEGGIRLAVRLTPKAARNAIEGTVLDANGQGELKVSVTTVPENGKANAALVKLLSKEWKIAKSCFDLVSGQTDRHKTLIITTSTPRDDLERLMLWIREKT